MEDISVNRPWDRLDAFQQPMQISGYMILGTWTALEMAG